MMFLWTIETDDEIEYAGVGTERLSDWIDTNANHETDCFEYLE